MHVKRVCKYFEVKILAEYYDLYVQNEYEYWNIWVWFCLFVSKLGYAWQIALKKKKSKIRCIDWYGHVMLFIDMWKLIIYSWEITIKINNLHILTIVI